MGGGYAVDGDQPLRCSSPPKDNSGTITVADYKPDRLGQRWTQAVDLNRV